MFLQFTAEIQGKFNTLQWRTVHLGGLYHLQEASHSTTVPNFVGDIQQFYFNNIPYIELARALKTDTAISGFPTIKVAAKFIKNATDNLHRPVTFRSKHTFIGKLRNKIVINFWVCIFSVVISYVKFVLQLDYEKTFLST